MREAIVPPECAMRTISKRHLRDDGMLDFVMDILILSVFTDGAHFGTRLAVMGI